MTNVTDPQSIASTRNGARAALAAYQASPNLGGNGDESDLIDLIADLMHLADTFDVSGEWAAEKAADHYRDEVGPENF